MAQLWADGHVLASSEEERKVTLYICLKMLLSVLRNSRASGSFVRASPWCVVRVQESLSKLLYSSQTPQAPDSQSRSSSEPSADPFLAHLQQKTEKELFEILRKQQQQPDTQDEDDDKEVPVSVGTLVRTEIC